MMLYTAESLSGSRVSDQIFQIRVFISMRFRYILAIYQFIVDFYKFTKQFPAPLF